MQRHIDARPGNQGRISVDRMKAARQPLRNQGEAVGAVAVHAAQDFSPDIGGLDDHQRRGSDGRPNAVKPSRKRKSA